MYLKPVYCIYISLDEDEDDDDDDDDTNSTYALCPLSNNICQIFVLQCCSGRGPGLEDMSDIMSLV